MKKGKGTLRCLALLALGLLLLFLCACGAPDPEAGEYLCVAMESGGVPLEAADCRLLLDSNGTGRLRLNGLDGTILWRRDGGALTVDCNGEELSGSIGDGVIRLTDGAGLELTLAREELAEAMREELAVQRESATLRASVWLGDWYGWWRITDSAGELEDTWYDLCAHFAAQADGRLLLTLWDEDQSADEPMAELLLRVSEDGGAVAEEGYFWLQTPEAGEWTLRLNDGEVRLTGHHEGGGESFDYTLCLRRWGERWPEEAEKPYYYGEWYLPLVEAGKSMPDAMEIQK